ncbi:MAG: DUF4268 domain-containing protein [Candidatus Thorarchaeota archaeon]
MRNVELGKLKTVDPRSIWPDEARDFTPWLNENIELLSEAIGADIEIVEREGSVSDFRVDLFGTDLSSGRPIVIENQLTPTDHDHLGKVMAYASGRNARIAVWISTEFRDAHRDTLEWLNSISDEDHLFFGIQLVVHKIGGSLPAPHFEIVVQPSDWSKEQRSKPLSPKMEAYREFFSGLLARIKKDMPGFTSARKGSPQNWFEFPTGRSGFRFAISFGKESRVKTELYIDTGSGEKNKASFDELYSKKEKIENEMGFELSWERLEGRRASRIAVYRDGSIEDAANELKGIEDWAVNMLRNFNNVLRERISSL